MVKITPLFDNILLEKVEYVEEKTAGGIYIPREGAEDSPAMGKIVAMGKGKAVKKAVELYGLKEGMEVIYSRYSGTDVKIGGKEYVLISVKDLLGIVAK